MNTAADMDYQMKYEELLVNYQRMQYELNELKRMIFGTRHERFAPASSPEQLTLGLNTDSIQPPARITQTIQYTRKKAEEKQKPRRLPLPSHLPRERVLIEPKENIAGLKDIGEEITEELEYIPGKLFVRQYVRVKYGINRKSWGRMKIMHKYWLV
jgi:transposase